MRLVTACFALIVSLALSCAASAEEFAALQRPAVGPVAVGVIEIGPELTEKAEDYGPREIERLTRRMQGALMDALMDAGRFSEIDQPGANVLLVVIEDAQPNRPTFRQLSVRPGLSARSLSLGGARVTAILTDPAGEELGRFAYAWRTPSLDSSQYATVWADADTAFSRFARLIAEELQDQDDTEG
ncbi:MAG: hypothetical protein RIA71_10865 [Oceanicaulis sp.]